MSTTVGTPLSAQVERRVYGWGLKSEPIEPSVSYCRDIQLVRRSDGTTDLDLVDGFPNLEQDLRIALGTALGADLLNVAFGFDGLRIVSEEQNRLMVRERLRGAVVQVLRADPRVASVTRVLIGDEISAFHADGGTASPAAEYGILNIEAGFRIVGGKEVSLSLGPVAGGA